MSDRVLAACDKEKGKFRGDPVDVLLLLDEGEHLEECPVTVDCEEKAAVLIVPAEINDPGVPRHPVASGARIGDAFLIRTERAHLKKPGTVTIPQQQAHPACHDRSRGQYQPALASRAADDGSVQIHPVRHQISSRHEGAHAVSQQEIRLVFIFFPGISGDAVQVCDDGRTHVPRAEVSQIAVIPRGQPMPQMVVSDHRIAIPVQKQRKILISVDHLHHSM